MTRAHIIGVGMPRFGKLPDQSIKQLSAEATRLALKDAGLELSRIEAVWFANSAWGINGGQDCIRGEVALRAAGLSAIPIVNVENACAGGSTALHGAVLAVSSGAYDVVLALGAEKVFQPSRLKMFAGFLGGLDVEALPELIERAERANWPPNESERSERRAQRIGGGGGTEPPNVMARSERRAERMRGGGGTEPPIVMARSERSAKRELAERAKSEANERGRRDGAPDRDGGGGGTEPPNVMTTRRSEKPKRGRSLTQWPKLLFDAYVVADHFQLDVARLALGLLKGSRKRNGKGERSPFMDVYAYAARAHMKQWGSTARQLALIASKNHAHGALNPLAQIQRELSVEEVLADAAVAYPLTRAMCAPIGDGAAAAIVCSERFAREHGLGRAVSIRASVLQSGARTTENDERTGVAERASRRAYELGSLGPNEIHVAEVHDATAFGELHQSEALGFCEPGMGGVLAESGATKLGGRIPLNPSGGLECRGHPIAASGLAQIHEIVTQLRGEAGPRQVAGARIGLTQNGGGFLGGEEAAFGVHVLEGPRT